MSAKKKHRRHHKNASSQSHHLKQKPAEENVVVDPAQINARKKVIDILSRVESRQAYTDKLLDREIDNFNEADRGLITETVNGTLRWRFRLDWVLSQLYVGEYDNLIPEVKNNLRSSIYQLMYLDRIPAYAVLNEAVEIAKTNFNQKTANLVNAILRNFLRQQKKLEYVEMQLEYLDRLSVSLSHPKWLIQRWVEQWGVDDTLDLCAANNARPRLSARVNSLSADRETIFRTMEERGISYEIHPDFSEYFWVDDFSEFRKLDFLKRGWVTVQDISTGIPVRLLKPKPGDVVVDLCAAPGGKASYMAEMMKNKGTLIALEKHPNRARVLRENLKRTGIEIGLVSAADALSMPLKKQADRILVDAPCTGLGVLSKRVDLKWKRTRADIENMQRVQVDMLKSAAAILKPGGTMVYSTCTIEVDENENVVAEFLKTHPEFELDDLREDVPISYLWDHKSVRTFSHRHRMDGSFAVRFRRTPAPAN